MDGVPPNMSVRIATPSPVSTRFTASMISLATLLASSSAPIVMASICFCGPITCSSAARNSSARRPWVTRTRPIIKNSSRALFGAPHERRHLDHPEPSARGFLAILRICMAEIGKPAPVLFSRDSGAYMVTKSLQAIGRRYGRQANSSVVVSAATTSGRGSKPGATGILRYRNTMKADFEGFRRRQPRGIVGREIDHQADDGLAGSSRQRRMPRPRISIRPASSAAGRTNSRPSHVSS